MVVHLQMKSLSTGDLKITDEENTRETNQNSTLPQSQDTIYSVQTDLADLSTACKNTQEFLNKSKEIPGNVIQSYGVGIMPQSFRCPRQHPPNFLHTRLPYPPPFFGGQCGGQWSNTKEESPSVDKPQHPVTHSQACVPVYSGWCTSTNVSGPRMSMIPPPPCKFPDFTKGPLMASYNLQPHSTTLCCDACCALAVYYINCVATMACPCVYCCGKDSCF
ncbi:hypothetical protein JYU34_017860 [Plutella xylostella]|uniref:Uncharacterized protein n=1 Tax=Plutella xylostella TaxID=51655 RepID=A0ABQ7PZ57_PLUXY|nr:hypothetical protein JYU34_017860 [Plutella xylostella]